MSWSSEGLKRVVQGGVEQILLVWRLKGVEKGGDVKGSSTCVGARKRGHRIRYRIIPGQVTEKFMTEISF